LQDRWLRRHEPEDGVRAQGVMAWRGKPCDIIAALSLFCEP
jgi:hypothetical protein